MAWKLTGIELPDGTILPWGDANTDPPGRGRAVEHLLLVDPHQAALAEAVNDFASRCQPCSFNLTQLAALKAAAIGLRNALGTPAARAVMRSLAEKVAVACEEWNITEARLLAVCATLGLLDGYDDAHDGLMRAHRRCEAAVVELLQAAETLLAVAEATWRGN